MQDILFALGNPLLILMMISSVLGLLLAIVGKLSKKNNLCKIARRMSIVAIVSSATFSAIAAYLPTLNTKSRSFSFDWSRIIILLAIVLGAALITLLISKGVKKGEETVEQSASVPASAASIKQQEMPTPEQSESKDRAMLIPKSLLVIAILNVLIRLYDGLGYLEIIGIALIAAALYLVLKGKKSIANICGILVPVLVVLGSVQALPHIAYWPVPTTIAFLATLILSVLFTIATLKAKPQQKATPVQTAPMQAVKPVAAATNTAPEKAVEVKQQQNPVVPVTPVAPVETVNEEVTVDSVAPANPDVPFAPVVSTYEESNDENTDNLSGGSEMKEMFPCGALQPPGIKVFGVVDNGVVYGDKTFTFAEITSINLSTAPSPLTNGIALMVVDGHTYNLCYRFKDRERAAAALNYAKAKLDEAHGMKKNYKFAFTAHTGTSLEVYDSYIILAHMRSGGVGASLGNLMTGGNAGGKRISFSDITAIQFKEPAGMTVGFIQFAYHGSVESKGNVFNAINDENAIPVSPDNLKIAREIVAFIEEKREELRRPQTTVVQSPVSAMDELKKLKELLDLGIVTQEEFDAKKKQLLGL